MQKKHKKEEKKTTKNIQKTVHIYTVFQKKWRQNSNHHNYGISYQNLISS